MKNIGLLTKESTNQFKSKWMLFLFFLLFLILSMGIITGLIHFTYSFGHEAKKYDSLDRYSTLEMHGPQDEESVDKNGDYYKYLTKLVDEDTNKTLGQESDKLETLLKDKGNAINLFKNGLVYSDSKNTTYKSSDYLNNTFVMWAFTSSLKEFGNESSSENFLKMSVPNIETGLFKGKVVQPSMFYVGPDTNYEAIDATKGDHIYDWQRRKNAGPSVIAIDKAMRGFSTEKFNVKFSNAIIVTPTFLKSNHLKIGQTIPLLFKSQIIRVTIAATGLTPGETVSNHSDRIALNPVLFNKFYDDQIVQDKNANKWIPEIEAINPNVPLKNTTLINQFYQSQYDTVRQKFKNSFTSDALDVMLDKMEFGRTPIKSYQMQFMIYNLFSWIVTAILLALLIVAYWFIQGLIIRANKSLLINLKAVGLNKLELGYYLGISFLPVLIVGSGIGLAIGQFLYWLLSTTLGNSVGFVMKSSPTSMLGYIIFVCVFAGLLIVGAAMAINGTRGDKLSIHEKSKLTVAESLFLGIKSWKIFENSGFANVIYSFQISNLLKAFATFIVTILSLVVLGTSLQFISSIGGTLDKRPFMYEHSGNSLSFRENEDGQIENTNKPISEYHALKSRGTLVFGKGKYKYKVPNSINPYKALLDWGAGFIHSNKQGAKNYNDMPMYDQYFNQVYELDDFYKENQKGLADKGNQTKIDKEIQNIASANGIDIGSNSMKNLKKYVTGAKLYGYLDSMDRSIFTYKSNFGKKAIEPKIFFKSRPKDRDFVAYSEMHDGLLVSNSELVKLFNSKGSKYDLASNEIVINNFIARRYDYEVGDTVRISFKNIAVIPANNKKENHVHNNTGPESDLDFTIKAIDDTLYNQNEAIVNFDAIRSAYPDDYAKSSDYRNAVVSKNVVPYDLEYFTMPVGIPELSKDPSNAGASIWDYFPDALNSALITNFDFSSLPVIKSYYMMKTAEFRSFASIISGFLAVVSLAIVCVISILIAYENKKNILVMKTLGYSTGRVIAIFATIYAIMIAVGFIASIFIGGALIDSFTGVLATRLGLALTHMYTAETILVPFAIAVVFCATIVGIIVDTYKKTSVDEITFAE